MLASRYLKNELSSVQIFHERQASLTHRRNWRIRFRCDTRGSRSAVEPAGQLAAYSADKAGVVALTKAIADETKGTNITANVILPSVIDTPKNREAMGSENADKWVKPESLAQLICFLGSEAAQDMRGAAIPIYGDI